MRRLWFVFYNVIIVPSLWTAIYVAAAFKRKVRRGIRGRKNFFPSLHDQIQNHRASSTRIWFHSSSLGEFEQAKPIIAELKRRRPDVAIFVSFFSPSGYEHSKNYKLADIITYIPFDSYWNAQRFVKMLDPHAAIMVRYDVWPNHIWALKRAGVPTFLANATMKMNSARHIPVVNSFHHAVYDNLDYILTVSDQDISAFKKFRLASPVLAAIGDTRYDQVWQQSAESKTRHILTPELTSGRTIIVVGSSWDSDEEVLVPVLAKLTAEHSTLLTVLVPHEPTLENIERIERELIGKLSSIRFSDLQDYNQENVIIIDSVGILMALYQYAHIAYVGGSFKHGVHNVLEAAVYGTPVLFGPQYQNSQEAVELVREQTAFVGNNEHELYMHLNTLLADSRLRTHSGAKARTFVEQRTGATQRFLSYLEKVL